MLPSCQATSTEFLAAQADNQTPKIKVNSTQVHDHMRHPVHDCDTCHGDTPATATFFGSKFRVPFYLKSSDRVTLAYGDTFACSLAFPKNVTMSKHVVVIYSPVTHTANIIEILTVGVDGAGMLRSRNLGGRRQRQRMAATWRREAATYPTPGTVTR